MLLSSILCFKIDTLGFRAIPKQLGTDRYTFILNGQISIMYAAKLIQNSLQQTIFNCSKCHQSQEKFVQLELLSCSDGDFLLLKLETFNRCLDLIFTPEDMKKNGEVPDLEAQLKGKYKYLDNLNYQSLEHLYLPSTHFCLTLTFL